MMKDQFYSNYGELTLAQKQQIIERSVKECQRAYTKALKQRNKNENNDRLEPFFRKKELTLLSQGRYSYRDIRKTSDLPNATNTINSQ